MMIGHAAQGEARRTTGIRGFLVSVVGLWERQLASMRESNARKRPDPECRICRGTGLLVRRDVPERDPEYGQLVACRCTAEAPEPDELLVSALPQLALPGTEPLAPQRSSHGREMTKFSYSMLAEFERCRLRFRLKYLKGQNTDDPRARDLKVGSMVHAALHALLTLEPHERSESCLQTLFDSAWRTHCGRILWERGEKDYWEGAAWRCVSQYFPAVRQLPKPKLEQHFSFDLGQWKINGRIDRIDEPRPGEHEVIDYKAFEASLTEEQAISDLQTVLYYFGAKELCDVPPLRITYLFLQDGAAVTVRPNGTDMDEALSAVDALIAEIRACTDFPPRRNQFCGNCSESGKCAATKLAT